MSVNYPPAAIAALIGSAVPGTFTAYSAWRYFFPTAKDKDYIEFFAAFNNSSIYCNTRGEEI
jgi:hypothetical protein